MAVHLFLQGEGYDKMCKNLFIHSFFFNNSHTREMSAKIFNGLKFIGSIGTIIGIYNHAAIDLSLNINYYFNGNNSMMGFEPAAG